MIAFIFSSILGLISSADMTGLCLMSFRASYSMSLSTFSSLLKCSTNLFRISFLLLRFLPRLQKKAVMCAFSVVRILLSTHCRKPSCHFCQRPVESLSLSFPTTGILGILCAFGVSYGRKFASLVLFPLVLRFRKLLA